MKLTLNPGTQHVKIKKEYDLCDKTLHNVSEVT